MFRVGLLDFLKQTKNKLLGFAPDSNGLTAASEIALLLGKSSLDSE